MIKVTVQKNLIALEDMLFGVGTVMQTRGNQQVEVTKINAMNMPYDATVSLAERIAEMDSQYALMNENRDLLMGAIEVVALLQALQVNIDDLAAWLANGSNQLSAFQPFVKRVTQDETLGDNLNYVMLEDTVIEDGVVITLGVDTELFVLKGEEFIP